MKSVKTESHDTVSDELYLIVQQIDDKPGCCCIDIEKHQAQHG